MGRLRPEFLLLAIALIGCSKSRIRGVVANQEIPVKSTFFFAQDGVYGDDSLLGIVLSSLTDGCADYGYYFTASRDLSSPEQLSSAWGAVFPREFWEVGILLRTGPPSDVMTGQNMDGVPWDAPLNERGTATGEVVHHVKSRDGAYWDGTADAAEYFTDYQFNGGNLWVDSHAPGQRIQGTYTVSTVEEGDARGVLEIGFNAVFCPEADMLP